MDGFDSLGRTKLIMATNRPDTLDPALMRPGRLDRKIEVPLPNEQARLEILKIHAGPVNKHGEIDYEAIVKVRTHDCFFARARAPIDVLIKLSDGFNGADLRNVVTEAGMFAIRDDRYAHFHLTSRISSAHLFFPREYIQQEDLTKAARKVGEAKKHESKHARPLGSFCVASIVSNFLSSLQPNWMFQHSKLEPFSLSFTLSSSPRTTL